MANATAPCRSRSVSEGDTDTLRVRLWRALARTQSPTEGDPPAAGCRHRHSRCLTSRHNGGVRFALTLLGGTKETLKATPLFTARG